MFGELIYQRRLPERCGARPLSSNESEEEYEAQPSVRQTPPNAREPQPGAQYNTAMF
jgi:hypothetical protein